MKENFDEVLSKVTDFLTTEARTETVVGKEFKLGEFTCVPVIKVGLGFGYGGGEGVDEKRAHGEGNAAGAGVTVEPIGFLATKGNEITFVQAKVSKGLSAAIEKMPEVFEKYFKAKEKEEVLAN